MTIIAALRNIVSKTASFAKAIICSHELRFNSFYRNCFTIVHLDRYEPSYFLNLFSNFCNPLMITSALIIRSQEIK